MQQTVADAERWRRSVRPLVGRVSAMKSDPQSRDAADQS